MQTWLFTIMAPLCGTAVLESGKSPGRIVVCGRFGVSVGSCAGSVMVLCTFADVVNTASEVGSAPCEEPVVLVADEGDAAGELPLTTGLVAEGLALLGDATGTDADGLVDGLGDGLADVPDGTCTSGRLNPLQLCSKVETRVSALEMTAAVGDVVTAQVTQLCRELATATVHRQAVVVQVFTALVNTAHCESQAVVCRATSDDSPIALRTENTAEP